MFPELANRQAHMETEQLRWVAIKILEKAPHEEILSAFQPLLKSFVEDISQLRLQWHPLGFLKSTLGVVPGVGSIRFHIWHPHLRQPQEPLMLIHHHNWMLNSHLIYGTLTNELYDVVITSPESATHKVYSVDYQGDHSTLKATDQFIICRNIGTQKFQSGQDYDVPIGQYHTTVVEENILTSTVVVSSRQTDRGQLVLGPLSGEPLYEYHRVMCDTTIAYQLVTELNAQLYK